MHPIRTVAACTAAALAIGLGAAAAPASAGAAQRADGAGVVWVSGSGGTRGTTGVDDLASATRDRHGRWACRGVPATDVVAADGDFVGTDADEVIVVLGSNSHVQAEGGDDTICVYGNHAASHEFSTIFGGDGDDVILGLSGALEAYGDDGEDVLIGNGTEMWFFGGNGSDDLNAAGATSAIMDGGDWGDRITGSPGIDVIQGGQGADGIWGWGGADEIDGGTEDDSIHGGDGFDQLDGGDGWYDRCYDSSSEVNGADIVSCIPTLTQDAEDDLVFG